MPNHATSQVNDGEDISNTEGWPGNGLGYLLAPINNAYAEIVRPSYGHEGLYRLIRGWGQGRRRVEWCNR